MKGILLTSFELLLDGQKNFKSKKIAKTWTNNITNKTVQYFDYERPQTHSVSFQPEPFNVEEDNA